jgi:hypothetical protein
MPQGMQIWDASGNLILEISDRIARVLGVASITGGTDGSVTNAGFSTGTPFWACVPVASGRAPVPDVSLSGTTLSWDFTPGIGYAPSYRLVYGVY